MNQKIENIFFLGIGGIGMSALARYFLAQGHIISGYDKTKTPLTLEMEDKGINIYYEDKIQNIIHTPDYVIYTPAIPKDNLIFNHLKALEIPFYKRAEILGNISKEYFTIAVAGTHGKTTITSLIAHILQFNNQPIIAFIGGICKNYSSNFLLSKNPKIMVVEADEFDRSFLTLHPDIAIVSSMDADHLDIYDTIDFLKKSFFMFTKQIKNNGLLIINDGLEIAKDLKVNFQKYSVEKATSIIANNAKVINGNTHFTLTINGEYSQEIETFLPGIHNILNISAAVAACYHLGISDLQIAEAVKTYKGVQRRFDQRIKRDDVVYIDDYAHHPAEIAATLKAVKSIYPAKKITVIFQPHLFSRTRDFGDDFAKSLSIADQVLLMEIYPAREKPIKGINSQWLLDKITSKEKQIVDFDNVVETIIKNQTQVLLTLGAGNIDLIIKPIEEALS